MIKATRIVGPLLGIVFCLSLSQASAEFYRWTDEQGRERVSNLRPRTVGGNGHPDPKHHPWSIRSQHAAMRAELQRDAAKIEAAQAAASSAAARRQSAFKALLDGIDIAPVLE